MSRPFSPLAVVCLGAAIIFLTLDAFAGNSELATYYPSPAGEYNELKANQKLTLPVKPVDTTVVPGLMPGEIWVKGDCPPGTTWNSSTGVCG